MVLRRSLTFPKQTIQNAFQGLDKTCPLDKVLWRDAKHFTTASYQGKSDQICTFSQHCHSHPLNKTRKPTLSCCDKNSAGIFNEYLTNIYQLAWFSIWISHYCRCNLRYVSDLFWFDILLPGASPPHPSLVTEQSPPMQWESGPLGRVLACVWGVPVTLLTHGLGATSQMATGLVSSSSPVTKQQWGREGTPLLAVLLFQNPGGAFCTPTLWLPW